MNCNPEADPNDGMDTPLLGLVRAVPIRSPSDLYGSFEEGPALNKEPFTILGLKELLSKPAKQFMVESWFGRHDICMLFGDSGAGKTFVMVEVAVCAAVGVPIAGKFSVPRPLNVLLCYEEGREGMPERIRQACEQHGVTETSESFGRIFAMEEVPKLYQGENELEGVSRFIERVAKFCKSQDIKIDLIVLDTLADAAQGSNENDNGDASIVNGRAKRITDALDCALWYVHHAPKDGGGYRGASAYKGKCDFMLEIRGTENPRILSCFKSKDCEAFESLSFMLKPKGKSAVVEWGDKPPESLGRAAEADKRKAELIRVLRDHASSVERAMPVARIRELVEVDISLPKLRNMLADLRKDPKSAVEGLEKKVQDASGRQNRIAWHYYLDKSFERVE